VGLEIEKPLGIFQSISMMTMESLKNKTKPIPQDFFELSQTGKP